MAIRATARRLGRVRLTTKAGPVDTGHGYRQYVAVDVPGSVSQLRVTFHRLAEDDLPMLHRWLNEPGVVEWWEGEDVSWDAVVRDYRTQRDDSTEHWIASVNGRDVGWIQCYLAADDPDETDAWWALGVDRKAAGIDYLIGDRSDRGHGMGSAVIRAFVIDVVFGQHPEWTQACAGPFAANVASCRALEKAGLRFVGQIDDDEGPCRLMVATREDMGLTS